MYGAGSAFAIVPIQYIKIDEDFLIFIDYPLTYFKEKEKAVTIHLDGDSDFSCNLKIIWINHSKIT